MGGVDDPFGRVEPARQDAQTDQEGGGETEQQVGSRPGHGHEGGAPGVALGPFRVIGRAGPPNHPAAQQVGNDGNDDHSHRLALDVGYGIQGDLAATLGGVIAQFQARESMAGFMHGGGEQKRQVPGRAIKKQ